MKVESSVRDRYSKAAQASEAALCCPVEYNQEYLKVIPSEVIERDYGCGDPSKYLKEGETVLDLGSGTGKICFIASQVVGKRGRVIGVDMNDDMLAVAETARHKVAEKIGYSNVEFRKGKIQDLHLNRDRVDQYLKKSPIQSEQDFQKFETWSQTEQAERPLVSDDSVDVVVSNCVLNLVATDEKNQLMKEIFRVLKKGGRAVISDIVSDEVVPAKLQADSELWSGCISGAYQEAAFLKAFEDAGFYGIRYLKRESDPWQVVDGIVFRSVTIEAFKGKEGACWDHNEAVIYQGPFSQVIDDDGHRFVRGEPIAVCRKTYDILNKEPYASSFLTVPPVREVSEEEVKPFSCTGGYKVRSPQETKGQNFRDSDLKTNACC